MWAWTSQEQALADGHVPPELRWPIPVVCRDVNDLHQRGTRLMHAEDIVDFVRHELHGEEWNEADLEQALQRLYDGGGGTFDPATIIRGPTDFCKFDAELGVADAVPHIKPPYSDVFPECSRPPPLGLIGEFLQQVERSDKSAAKAHIMLRAEGCAPVDLPRIEEDEDDSLPPSVDTDHDEPTFVGPFRKRERRPKRRGRREHPGDYPASEVMKSAAVSGRTRGLRSRRGDGKKNATIDILLLNSSGKPQYLAALQVNLGCSIMMNQEHHCGRSALVDLQFDARDLGWKLVGAAAHLTPKDGYSAGVSIATKQGIGVGSVGMKFDHSPASALGRVAAAWVHAGPRTGMVLVSVYLFHSEGMTERNRSIIKRALAVVRAYGSPWIIAGDFNMSPSVFAQHCGCLLESANAYIMSTKQTTHRPRSATHNTLDFAVCSASVEPWVESISVDEAFQVAPHRAVRLKLRADPRNYLVHGFKRPRAFAKRPPIGCARRPVLPLWAKHRSAHADGVGGHAASHPATVDEKWSELCHAMETELCRMHGHVNASGLAAAAYSGRGEGLRVIQRLALPMRASSALGKVSIPAHALVWLSTRVRELACIARKIERGRSISESARVQWTRIMDKVLASKGLPEVIRKLGIEWIEKLEFIHSNVPGQDTYSLERIAEVAYSTAESLKLEHLDNKSKSWQAFVDKQLKTGAAAAHRLVKRDAAQCNDNATVGSGEKRTASPQEVLQHDLEEWRAIWCRDGSPKEAPWREAVLNDAGLPPITAEQVGKAARTFPTETSIGCDSFPPSAIASLSVQLRACIADFLNLLEEEGAWPHKAAATLIHLIPKSDGGRRPIGVLPSIVRVWERIRKLVVQDWLRRNSRAYDWASQGRSSEGAAWHQSLLDEAAKADGLASAAALMDLAKAFERVALHLVWEAGVRHGFPLKVLRLILEAFAFARHLSYQGAVSEAILTLSAVLAGGGIRAGRLVPGPARPHRPGAGHVLDRRHYLPVRRRYWGARSRARERRGGHHLDLH